MGLYMATTKIDPVKTAGEITNYLRKIGSREILTVYEDCEIVALKFGLEDPTSKHKLIFQLPVKWEPVAEAMYGTKPRYLTEGQVQQARRTAWRIVYRWVQAQVALIETGSVDTAEVFFPYMVVGEKTLYHAALEGGFNNLLPAPK